MERDETHARRYRDALGPERLQDLLAEEGQVGAARPRVREPCISVPRARTRVGWKPKPQRYLPSARTPSAGRGLCATGRSPLEAPMGVAWFSRRRWRNSLGRRTRELRAGAVLPPQAEKRTKPGRAADHVVRRPGHEERR